MKRHPFHLFCILLSITQVTHAASVSFISGGSNWKYLVGTSEASTPNDAWRAIGFNDASWPLGGTPIGYANPVNHPEEGNIATVLPDPSVSTPYQSVYFRKTFTVVNPATIARLDALVQIDDGFVAWINGTEIGRENVGQGTLFFNDTATLDTEPHVATITINNPTNLLVAGQNILTIHAFNAPLPNNDMFFDVELDGLIDDQPPTIINIFPEAGTLVRDLVSVEVLFSEPVIGVDAGDLRVNGVPATDMTIVTPSQYQFVFTQPATGTVAITWAIGHGITDVANPPNAFGGAGWNYTLDTNFVPQVIINEFLASNSGDLNNDYTRDDDRRTSDWIELYNRGSTSVNLDRWSITDNFNSKRKFVLPPVTLLPNSYLVIWAADPPVNPPTAIYTAFNLSANGEYLGLFDARTNVMSQFFPTYPTNQVTDVSYGRDQANPDVTGFFTVPTPGGPNTAGGAGVGPEVVFSVPGGTFTNTFLLTLSTPANTNATIRYAIINGAATTNNTIPTATSNLYTGPLSISNTVIVRARAFVTNANFLPGPPHSECFLRLSNNVSGFTSDLPIVVLHSVGSATVPGGFPAPDLNMIFAVFDTKYGRSALTNKPDLIVRAGVNLRGSSTQGYPKGSYAVETWNEFNNDQAVEVLDLPAESDWVLYAPNYFDRVLIHNPVAYKVSNDMGRYASRTRMVEVFVNTSGGPISGNVASTGTGMLNYNGVYVLEEKVKRDGDRVDVEGLRPQDTNAVTITGGYVLKYDRVDANERSFAAGGLNAGSPGLAYLYPDGLEMVTPQRVAQSNYIANYLNTFYNTLIGANWTNPVTGYAAYIDVDSFVDHNMLGVLTLNADWARLSGFFFKDRGKKLEMGPVWDHDRAEGTGDAANNDFRAFSPRYWTGGAPLGGGTDYGTDFFNANNVFANPWYLRLFRDTDFWQRWIDRYQEFRQDALDTNRINAMIDQMANEVRAAQVRENARWGGTAFGASDTRPRSGAIFYSGGGLKSPYTNVFDGSYQGEVDFLKRWWSDRIYFIDTNFLNRPLLSHSGGQITPGLQVTIADTSGKPGTQVYYTLDGTDPRAPGGGIAAGALLYSTAITISDNARLVARARNPNHRNLTGTDNPPTNSIWSGSVAATYVVTTPPLRITEIMYHPADPPAGDPTDDNEFEYIEIKNVGGTPLNLSRFSFTKGIDFTFPSTVLTAGQSAVVVANTNAFRARYGSGPLVLGVYTGKLDNGGERIVLEGALKEPIHDFSYSDDWYPATDGAGFSLVIVNDNAPLNTWGLKTSWRASSALNGSPAQNDGAPPTFPQVVINEALTHTDPPQVDYIELRNLSGSPANIGGWFLTDDFGNPKKFLITNGTVIAGNGFRTYTDSEYNSGPNAFGLSEHGEDLWLFSGDGVNLTGYAHGFDFGAAENGVSFGRHIISTGEDHFVAQSANTLNFANAGPLVGPIIISEIAYHPQPVVVGTNGYENFEDEYIELQNTGNSLVPLYDPFNPENRWQLRDAVDFIFPQTNLAAHSFALVVPFDPADAGALATFRSRVGVSPSVPVFGPFSGHLDNDEDSVELVKPGAPEPPGPPDFGLVPEILVERVHYHDTAPWPVAADGLGPTLQRINSAAYGNDPSNWVAAARTPGGAYGGGSPPVITSQPSNQVVVAYRSVTNSVGVSGTGPFSYQWRFNGNSIPGATSATLVLQNVQPSQEGNYSVLVMNPANSVLSSNAFLDVRIPATILQQPQTVSVIVSTNEATFGTSSSNATFSVSAISENPPLSFQWRRNGTNLIGATGTSITISNVSIANEGAYTVEVTDGVGGIVSQPAQLIPLAPIIYLLHPQSQIVAEGDTASMSMGVRGYPFPIVFRWRTSAIFLTNYVNEMTNTITIPNAPLGTGAVYSCVITNLATPFGPVAGLSRLADLVVVRPPTNSVGIAQSNITLSARPSISGRTLKHQWQFNGVDIPGATTTNLVLTNLRPWHAGTYTYTVINTNAGQSRGFNAVLTVLQPDTDGDGAPDWHEVDTGTNPNDPSSYLHISDIDKEVSGASIEFLAISNRTYSVQYSITIEASTWLKLIDVDARPTNHLERILDPAGGNSRFYRLITPKTND